MRERFRVEIDAAGKLREDYFQRQYGKKWKEEILKVNKKFLSLLVKQINVSEPFCEELREEINRQIDRGWSYLKPKMEEGYQRGILMGRECVKS